MTKYSGSEDVYKELVQDSDENWLYGLVSFAVVEEQRIEWMRHYEKQNQALPSAAEIRLWYEQQPSSVLLRAKGTAENALQAYSADVLEITLEDQRKAVEEVSLWLKFGSYGAFGRSLE